MTIILYFVFWLIGLFVTSFTLLPVLIILAFGIPTTLKLKKLKFLKPRDGIVKRYSVSLVLLSLIFIAMIMITLKVYPNGLIGLLFGGGMVIVFGLGKISKNEANVSDYLETNKESFITQVENVRKAILEH